MSPSAPAVLLLCLAPFAAAAQPAGSGAAAPGRTLRSIDVHSLEWSVHERVVLGDTGSAEVMLTARQPDGTPLDVAPPRLSVSAGSVGPPERVAPGQWKIVFLPKEQFPHVAILFATIEQATTSAVGFVPIHMWGKGQTTVRTKPKSKVTVFIGNESFGPVVADDDGAATVPIVVPPGPERAVARSVDEVGNESQKTIDLGVPSFNRLALINLDAVASADGDGVARLLAFVVDRKGAPLFEASFLTKASLGRVDDEPVGLSPGMFMLSYRPGKAAPGTATVEVALAGASSGPAGAPVTTEVGLLSGKPVKATVELTPTTLVSDDARKVTADVRLFDQAGNAVASQAAATADVDFGRIDAIAELAGGVRRISWIVPATLGARTVDGKGGGTPRDRATITVRLPTGEVLGEQSVVLLAGKPARLAFDPMETLVADGQSSVEVRLRAVDAAGNAIVPTGAHVDAAEGRVLAGAVEGRVYRARFVATPSDLAGFAVLRGSVGDLVVEQRVRLAPRPRARLIVGVGALVGSNYSRLVQAGPDVSLLVRLPGLDGSTHAGLALSMLQSVRAPDGVDSRAYPLALEAAWRPLLSPDLMLHIGAGAGFVITDETVTPAGGTGARTVRPGLFAQGVVGIGYRVGPGFVEVDSRTGYGVSFPDGAAGAPLGATVVVGYRFGI